METLAKYAGKIINGKPVFLEQVTLPENADITILVELPLVSRKEALTTQKTAEQFLMTAQNLRNELTTEDKAALDELESGKYRLKFDRRVDVRIKY